MLSQPQKTLITRATSALVAVAVVVGLFFFVHENGMRALCVFTVFWGTRELGRILFQPNESLRVRAAFALLIYIVFFVAIQWPENSGLGFAISTIALCCYSLIFERNFENLESLSLFQARSILGFFYIGLLPSFAYRLLGLPHGMIWFLALLAIVFVGDTMAYLVGMLLGRRKIMPRLSPKKTIEGAIGGLMGSMLTGALLSFFIPQSPERLVLAAACVGIIAQLGDLFESMLKRVANRKDSGSLMPGHGGVLDRLDGILFAAPVLFLFAAYFETQMY